MGTVSAGFENDNTALRRDVGSCPRKLAVWIWNLCGTCSVQRKAEQVHSAFSVKTLMMCEPEPANIKNLAEYSRIQLSKNADRASIQWVETSNSEALTVWRERDRCLQLGIYIFCGSLNSEDNQNRQRNCIVVKHVVKLERKRNNTNQFCSIQRG